MARIHFPNILSKTGLLGHKPRFHAASAAAQAVLPQLAVVTPVAPALKAAEEAKPVKKSAKAKDAETEAIERLSIKHPLAIAHRYWVGAFALLFLLVGVASVQLGSAYWTAHKIKPIVTSSTVHKHAVPLHGPNIAVAADQLPDTVQRITSQPIDLIVGTKTVAISQDDIKSWLHIVTDKKTKTAYIHLDQDAIGPSIDDITSKFSKNPVNQVTVTHPDGSQAVVVGGRNGASVGDPKELAKQLAPNVLGAKGMQLNVPLQSVPFQSVTAAAFDKLIEVNVVTKQMYLYDKGNFTRQYAVSAGAPATPTPIGQFKIYSKYAVQDMKGNNPDGSKYFQPNVRWINYFLPGGYAVHGVYWHPLSWFGAINSSHGCVGIPDDEAQWVYNWAPIGTTVITHT